MEPLAGDDPAEVAGYRLRARLGTGGMGRVYLAFTAAGRPVALKVVRPELGDDRDFRARFRQEVAAARRVNGLYTAQVIDADPDGSPPWLLTAYVPGPSLQEAVAAHGPLPEESVFLLMAGVAEALQAVHAAGLVHRDLKPSNVLLASDGPRVIDFGIARAVEATALTRTGTRIGSPGFMAPEQAEGLQVTPATDVFALGSVVAFAVLGRTPFGEGSDAALVYRIVHRPPNLDGCPSSLRGLLERCLAKAPAERPSPAEIVAQCWARTAGQPARIAREWLPAPVSADLARHAVPVPSLPQQTAAVGPSHGPGLGSMLSGGTAAGTQRSRVSRWPLVAGLGGGAACAAAVVALIVALHSGSPSAPPLGARSPGVSSTGGHSAPPGRSTPGPWRRLSGSCSSPSCAAETA